jgi:hypothetical protein
MPFLILISYTCSVVNCCCHYGKKLALNGNFVFFPIWICGHGESILKTEYSKWIKLIGKHIFNCQGKVY